MIVSITGGTGFIGRRLVSRHLSLGHTVRILSRRELSVSGFSDAVRWYRGDLTKSPELVSFVDGSDILYHCAGEIKNSQAMNAVHVEGTRSLIDAASGRISRWVQLSSVGAYGQRRVGVVTESTELNPNGLYEISKVKSDSLVGSAALGGAFELSIVRPSNVYGPDMSNQALFSLISMIDRGLFFYIGDQGVKVNYIHVDNVVAALMLCGMNSSAANHIFNLSDHCTMEDLVGIIGAALGRNVSNLRFPELPVRMVAKILGAIPGFPLTESRVDAMTGRSTYSINKIEMHLGYRHILSIEVGMREMVKYWLLGNR
jgi:nucleoside-diphosphate-sugar epimerase